MNSTKRLFVLPLKKPKILIVIDSLMMGGAQVVSLRLYESLLKSGYDCYLVTFYDVIEKNSFDFPGPEKESLGKNLNDFLGFLGKCKLISRLRSYIKKNKIDLVISCLPSTNCLSIISTIGLKSRIIATEHMDPAQDEDTNIKWRLLRRILYHLASSLVGVSQGVTDSFSWLPAHKRRTIYNFISMDSLPYVEPPDENKFLCLGRFINRKGFDDAINAFNLIKNHSTNATLNIYGYGPEKNRLENLIKLLNLQDRVKIFDPDKNSQILYKSHDIVLFPSYAEGLGNIILESMASARPVIAYDCNHGPRELIVQNETGYLVPVKDYTALAERMLYLINNSSHSKSMGLSALALFNRVYDNKNILNDWERLISEVINDQ
jgi:glycosyltransferase involved in cell wall biosynthesis